MRVAATDRRLVTHEGKKRGRVRKYRWTWVLRTVWNALLAVKRVKDDKVSPAYVFITSDGSPITKYGFKSAWQRAMNKWVADGHERFTEHDVRSRTANDAGELKDAQKILGDGAAIHVYRRGPQKVNPLR
jgi:integrase